MRLRNQWLCKQTMAGCIFTVCPTFEPKQLMNVFLTWIDQRNIPALNRIGDPDDIIGTVLVENSEVL